MGDNLRAFVGSTVDVWKVGPRDDIIWAASEALATAWPMARLPYTVSVSFDEAPGVVVVRVAGTARSPKRPLPARRTALEGAWSAVVQGRMGLSISARTSDHVAEVRSVVRAVADEIASSDAGRRAFSDWSEWRDVAATPAALAPTRRWLTESLSDSLDKDAMDEVQLLTSELVTNALRHAPGRVSVRYSLGIDSICVEVRDERVDLVHAAPTLPDPNAVSGRGLALVHELAARAGVTLDQEWKTSWFEYDLPKASAPSA